MGALFHPDLVVVPLVCVPGVDDVGEIGPGTDPDTSSLVVALDAGTGREVWRYENTEDAGDTSPDLRASVDGTVLTIAEQNLNGTDYPLPGDGRILDLATGEETPIAEPDPSPEQLGFVAPLPDGSSVRQYAVLGPDGLPDAAAVVHVSAEGEASELTRVAAPDVMQQLCVSPSGRYAAVLVAPDLVDNPYDSATQPLPERLETRIVEIGSGEQVATLQGFGISWCAVGPW